MQKLYIFAGPSFTKWKRAIFLHILYIFEFGTTAGTKLAMKLDNHESFEVVTVYTRSSHCTIINTTQQGNKK